MANSTAVARYRVSTPGTDVDALATTLEGEASISKVEVIGHQAESALTNKPAAATASRNVVELEITASLDGTAAAAEDAIEAAIAAEGSALTLVSTASTQTGAGNGFTLTADAPLLVADNDTPTQQEGAATVVVTLTCTNRAGGFATITSDVDTVYADGNGTVVFADGGDNTATITIDSATGDAAIDPFVFTVTAVDALGQSVDEVVTLTVTAP